MNNSVYIHIPFCEHICTYCDFCKQFYNKDVVNKYLNRLHKEIIDNYKHELIKTIYIGGGTPSCLSINELRYLLEITKIFNLGDDFEFTFEVNPENIDENKLKLLKEYRVNRISIGIETTNNSHLKYLGRNYFYSEAHDKVLLIKNCGFDNINVDLIYAIPNENMEDLKEDLKEILELPITHISTYSLMIEPNTKLFINKTKSIDEKIDYEMYQLICKTLKKKGFTHYEISNFCKLGYESKHNLQYWHNEHYYGFGLGSSGYLQSTRYDNTRSMQKYLDGNYIKSSEEIDLINQISYELILGFRLVKGINKDIFYQKYHKNLIDMYNIIELIEKEDLIDDGSNIYINYDRIYIENSILINFVGEV